MEEWLLYRHTGPSHVSYGAPFAYSGYGHSGYFVENYPGYDSFLRLTFGPDGVLKAWKKYSK